MTWGKKIGVVTVVAAVGTALALYLGVAHAAVSQTMHAFVHQDSTIGLTFDDGSQVGNQLAVPPTIPPGTYSIRVLDDTSEHNFHLVGPGVDQSTDIGGSSTPTWSVTLQPGVTYRFVCDNHPDFMYGTFQTSGTASSSSGSGSSGSGSSSSSSGSTSTSSGGTKTSSSGGSTTLAGTLAATLSPAGIVTFKSAGKSVAELDSGTYKVTVSDKASARSFVLQRKGGTARTISSPTFVGTHSVTVTLTPGQWSVYSQPGGKSKHSFTVT
jgi:hypothetical protein